MNASLARFEIFRQKWKLTTCDPDHLTERLGGMYAFIPSTELLAMRAEQSTPQLGLAPHHVDSTYHPPFDTWSVLDDVALQLWHE